MRSSTLTMSHSHDSEFQTKKTSRSATDLLSFVDVQKKTSEHVQVVQVQSTPAAHHLETLFSWREIVEHPSDTDTQLSIYFASV